MASTNLIWYNYCVRLARNPQGELRQVFSSDLDEEFTKSIQAYWENQATESFQEPSNTEILFQGELKIVNKIA